MDDRIIIAIISGASAFAVAWATGYLANRAKSIEGKGPAATLAIYSAIVEDLRIEVQTYKDRDVQRGKEIDLIRDTADEAKRAELRCLIRLQKVQDEIVSLRAQLRAVGIPIPEEGINDHD